MALVRRVLVTKASTLVKLKFYFPRVGGSRELGLGAKSPCHQGFNPGEIKISFSKGGGGHASLALVRTVLVTKASTLVKLEFYFSRVGG